VETLGLSVSSQEPLGISPRIIKLVVPAAAWAVPSPSQALSSNPDGLGWTVNSDGVSDQKILKFFAAHMEATRQDTCA
jgi:hypothetical protein